MPWTYEYERPSFTVDIIVMDTSFNVLLLKRAEETGKGMWALPGGHVDPGESPMQAAVRELKEETGLVNLNLKLFDSVLTREPSEGWRIKNIYYVKIVPPFGHDIRVKISSEHSEFQWYSINSVILPGSQLFVDHAAIIADFFYSNLMK